MSAGNDQRTGIPAPASLNAVAEAHARWPAAWLADAVFVDHLAARLPAGSEVDRAAALSRLAIADLYLACACVHGVAPAVEAFSRTILREVDAHVASFDRSGAFADEVRQALAAKLLVAAPGERPKLDDYAGSAPLSAWARVAAIRTALNLRRGKALATEHLDDRAVAEHAAAGDVEVDLIRRRYGPAFESAIAKALAGLPTRERTLLRLRLVDGMEVEAIATMYGVHRTTVTRWVGASRERLIEDTRRRLRHELDLSSGELASLAGMVQSQLHLSLNRLLGDR